MSPRWTSIDNAALYFYASEPHQRPHVSLVGPDWDVTIALDDLTVLRASGKVPRKTLRRAVALLRSHRAEAVSAFEATAKHRFPGTLRGDQEA